MKDKKVKKNTCKGKSSKKNCPECGFKIRGKKHEEGEHHKQKKGNCRF
jgi:hypothetical protein